MNKVNILIADDQILFAESLQLVIEGNAEEMNVVGIAFDGEQAVKMAETLKPDIILMDVRMPKMDGVTATKTVCERFPDIKVLILTTFDDDDLVHHAIGNGAVGYILKNIRPNELLSTLRGVSGGTMMVSPSVGQKLLNLNGKGKQQHAPANIAEVNFLLSQVPDLSRREAEVLSLIVKSLDNAEIAEELFLSIQTVRNYVSRIYAKLGVTDRLHAIQRVQSINR